MIIISRNRFSANCVQIKGAPERVLAEADLHNRYFAALVMGPSKSLEGQYLYYLAEWLEE